MRKVFLTILTAALVCALLLFCSLWTMDRGLWTFLCSGAHLFAQEVSPRIAIGDFEVREVRVTSEAICENLTTSLQNLKRFTIVERAQLESVLKEAGLSLSGLIDASTGVSAGKIKGVDIIVTGSVSRLGNIITLNARFINTTTGEVTSAKKVEGRSESDLAAMIDELAKKIEELFPLLGVVLDVEEKSIYIDLGSEQGIRKMDKLIVFREGEPLKDLKGEVVGVKKEDVGEIKILEVDKNSSRGEVIAITKEIQRGDGVRSKVEEVKAEAPLDKVPAGGETAEVFPQPFPSQPELVTFPQEELPPIDPKIGRIDRKKGVLLARGKCPLPPRANRLQKERCVQRATMEAISILLKLVNLIDEKTYHLLQERPHLKQKIVEFIRDQGRKKEVEFRPGVVVVKIVVPLDKIKHFLER